MFSSKEACKIHPGQYGKDCPKCISEKRTPPPFRSILKANEAKQIPEAKQILSFMFTREDSKHPAKKKESRDPTPFLAILNQRFLERKDPIDYPKKGESFEKIARIDNFPIIDQDGEGVCGFATGLSILKHLKKNDPVVESIINPKYAVKKKDFDDTKRINRFKFAISRTDRVYNDNSPKLEEVPDGTLSHDKKEFIKTVDEGKYPIVSMLTPFGLKYKNIRLNPREKAEEMILKEIESGSIPFLQLFAGTGKNSAGHVVSVPAIYFKSKKDEKSYVEIGDGNFSKAGPYTINLESPAVSQYLWEGFGLGSYSKPPESKKIKESKPILEAKKFGDILKKKGKGNG